MKAKYTLVRFTRSRRENLTNWENPHGATHLLICCGADGTEKAVSVVRRYEVRRYWKVAKRLNGEEV